MKCKILLQCLTIFAPFALAQAKVLAKCNHSLVFKISRLEATQPHLVKIGDGRVLIHNSVLEKILKDKKQYPLSDIIALLDKTGALDISQSKGGLVVAADNSGHSGGYNDFVWLRDLARVYTGLHALGEIQPGKADKGIKLARAMPELLSSDDQILVMLKNIDNPFYYHTSSDSVPKIRLLAKPREQGRQLTANELQAEAQWSHRQNDALALIGHSILDSIGNGDLDPKSLDIKTRASLILLVSYFQRVDFVTMADSGAWEEGSGVRTSSIALVTSFLERFQKGMAGRSVNANESQFFSSLQLNGDLENFIRANSRRFSRTNSEDILTTIGNSFKFLPRTLDRAYALLNQRLSGPELIEVDGSRTNDAAMFHMLLYPPAAWSAAKRAHYTEVLEQALSRPAGTIRYANDGFLYGGPTAVGNSHALSKVVIDSPDQVAVKGGDGRYRMSTRADRDQVYAAHANGVSNRIDNKDLGPTLALAGPGLEAQWTLQDSMMTQIYSQLYRETKNPEFLNRAWLHLTRALGQVSGKNEFTIEGRPISEFKMAEAWIPVRLSDGRQTKVAYFASPNSPLNWATAELAEALFVFQEALAEK